MRSAMLVLLTLTLALTAVTGTTVAQVDAGPFSMSRLELANAHVEYLFLDEVVAGRNGAMTAEVYAALWLLHYLQLPEVQYGDVQMVYQGE